MLKTREHFAIQGNELLIRENEFQIRENRLHVRYNDLLFVNVRFLLFVWFTVASISLRSLEVA